MPDPNADVANKQQGRSLENLLVSKNRKLVEDVTKLRVSFEALSSEHAKSEETVESLQAELTRQRGLNEKLENDLMSLNKDGADPKPSSSNQGLAGLDIGGGAAKTAERGASPAPGADTSILPIVTSQRDRFRQRNAELEEEVRKQFQSISDLRAEIKSLQADNLKLYEKVRYMQSYRDGSGPSSSSSYPPGGGVSGSSVGGSAGLLNGVMRSREDEIGKYKDKYEESMNPFEAFKGRVSVFPSLPVQPLTSQVKVNQD